MAAHLTDKEFMELKHAFSLLDTKGVGFLKIAEIRQILQSLGKCGTEEEVSRILQQVDTDGDGAISFPEFLNMMVARSTNSGMESTGALEHMFKIIDRNSDGFITHTEMKKALDELADGPVHDAEVENMIYEADSDGDGKVSFSEFVATMKKTYPEQYPQ